MSKIAFLFLTIDNVYYPQIWERYFQECPLKKSIYVHPKYPEQVTVPWMKDHIIEDLVPTKWGHLTNAFYQLLKAAFKDKMNSHVIFISDSCLPIRKLSTLDKYIHSYPRKTSFIHFKDNIDDHETKKILVCAKSTKQIQGLVSYDKFRDELAWRGYNCMYITSKTGAVIDGEKVTRDEFFNVLSAWGKDPDKKFVVLHHSILAEGINVKGLEAVLFVMNIL